MPNFNQLMDVAVEHYTNPMTTQKSLIVEGFPGGGKTAMGYEIADKLGIPREKTILWRPSFQQPVDLMGMPSVQDMLMHWAPPAMLAKLRDGEWFVIVDEVADCPPMMQNALCGLFYDRFLGEVHLGPDVKLFGTTNDVAHRSGAVRVVSKLPNRVMWEHLDQSVESWVEWAIRVGLNKNTIAFIHWKGIDALFDFDPERKQNATPRQWEWVSYLREDMKRDTFMFSVQGLVPEGLANEYVAFQRLVDELPPIDEIFASPETAKVSTETDVNYAVSSRLIVATQTVMDFENIIKYVNRMPVENKTLYIHAVAKRVPEIAGHPAYVDFAVSHAMYFGAGQAA